MFRIKNIFSVIIEKRYLLQLLIPIILLFAIFLPAGFAYADIGWTADEFINNPDTGLADEGNQTTMINMVSTFISDATLAFLSLAIIFFIWRVGITAVDRLVLSTKSAEQPYLTNIPYVGAYSIQKYPNWRSIFILFAKQLAIVAISWIIIQVLMGIIILLFGFVPQS